MPPVCRSATTSGNTTTATVSATAVVVTLGQGVQTGLTGSIDFWHSKKGQALINGFNGNPARRRCQPGSQCHFQICMDLEPALTTSPVEENVQVAAFYKTQYALPGSNVTAQVLATALNVYATTLSLGGTTAQAYGFTVSDSGLGADSFNVGGDGAAFGVAKKTTLNVFELAEGGRPPDRPLACSTTATQPCRSRPTTCSMPSTRPVRFRSGERAGAPGSPAADLKGAGRV